jgi:hypothetical protein
MDLVSAYLRVRARLRGIERIRAWVVFLRPVVAYARLVRCKLAVIGQCRYWRYMWRRPLRALEFLFFDPELTNFTYAIGNLGELAEFLATVWGIEAAATDAFIRELECDSEFRSELGAVLRTRPNRRHTALYGRRAGWYCAVRVLKPKVVIESGVHDGLGSSVLLRALERNRAEGADGKLIGIDLDPASGWLIPHRLRDRFALVVEDSKTALPRIAAQETVDLFIHDSNHSYDHESGEYRTIGGALSSEGVLLSDNAHATDALERFSEERGRSFAFWRERPKGHFYPGAGIGISTSRAGRLSPSRASRVKAGGG